MVTKLRQNLRDPPACWNDCLHPGHTGCSSSSLGLLIRPLASMQHGWGWMPDGQHSIGHGTLTEYAQCSSSFAAHHLILSDRGRLLGTLRCHSNFAALHLIVSDGTIACSWRTPCLDQLSFGGTSAGLDLVSWRPRPFAAPPSWSAHGAATDVSPFSPHRHD